MEADEIYPLVRDLESERVERNASLSHADRVRQAVCAYANDLPGSGRPGYILIGVDDQGNPVGTPITDQLLQNLSHMKDDGLILPRPSLEVQKISFEGVPIAVVKVQPGAMPPTRLEGRVWIRVGPRCDLATEEEERRLIERRRYGHFPFDQQAMPEAAYHDLDAEWFTAHYLTAAVAPEVLAENGRTLRQRLRSLRLLAPDADTPTIAGLLVCGVDPRAWIAGAYVQFVRFAGTE